MKINIIQKYLNRSNNLQSNNYLIRNLINKIKSKRKASRKTRKMNNANYQIDRGT